MSNEVPALTFEDAMLLLKSGKEVRRASWPSGSRMFMKPIDEYSSATFLANEQNETRHAVALTSADILNDDWQEYVPAG